MADIIDAIPSAFSILTAEAALPATLLNRHIFEIDTLAQQLYSDAVTFDGSTTTASLNVIIRPKANTPRWIQSAGNANPSFNIRDDHYNFQDFNMITEQSRGFGVNANNILIQRGSLIEKTPGGGGSLINQDNGIDCIYRNLWFPNLPNLTGAIRAVVGTGGRIENCNFLPSFLKAISAGSSLIELRSANTGWTIINNVFGLYGVEKGLFFVNGLPTGLTLNGNLYLGTVPEYTVVYDDTVDSFTTLALLKAGKPFEANAPLQQEFTGFPGKISVNSLGVISGTGPSDDFFGLTRTGSIDIGMIDTEETNLSFGDIVLLDEDNELSITLIED